MLIFYPILYNGKQATMVNLSNVHFGVYCADEQPINLRLNQLTRIKTGSKLSQLRIIYDSEQCRKPVDIYFFSLKDREEFIANLVEAQLVDQSWCCFILLPSFLLQSCCGLFRFNQLYVRKQTSADKKAALKLQQKSKKKIFPSDSDGNNNSSSRTTRDTTSALVTTTLPVASVVKSTREDKSTQ